MTVPALILKDLKPVSFILGTILYSPVATMHVTFPSVDHRYSTL